ncbi:MAG: aldo/keto reductase [Miltoncostaeaceae bacterium]
MSSRRPLGGTGIDVSTLCLGGNVFGWSADPDTSFAVLDAYVAAGGNFIDTADVYSAWAPGNRGGESEEILGRWLSADGNQDRVVVATKVGWEAEGHPSGLGREQVRRGVEASLSRLRVDRIDVYFAHKDDPSTPLDETLGALTELVEEGLVGSIGASNYSAERFSEALAISEREGLARFEVLQPHYSLMERTGYEGSLQDAAVGAGVAVTPYFSLARGFLTGKYRPDTPIPESVRAGGVVSQYLNDRGFAVLQALDRAADAHAASPAQVAIAWLAAQPGVASPIASATSVAHVEDLAGAMDLQLDEEHLAALSDASR